MPSQLIKSDICGDKTVTRICRRIFDILQLVGRVTCGIKGKFRAHTGSTIQAGWVR